MIRLAAEEGSLVVAPLDDIGRGILANPLHKLFLRGEMGAVPTQEGHIWRVPWEATKTATLEKLVQHLAKYQVTTEKDAECASLLAQLEASREEFRRLLSSALKVKLSFPASARKRLSSALAPQLTRKLTSLQLHGVGHLMAIRNGANFSVPGSGKTAVALAYLCLLRLEQEVDGLLVIGPASAFGPWEHEFEETFGRKPEVVRLAGRPRREREQLYLLASDYELLLTTYHTAARDVDDLCALLRSRRYLLVLDESHYVKRPVGGKLAGAVMRLAPYAERRIILTGTPMPNGPPDLWSQMTFLWPQRLPLGSSARYLREIAEQEKPDLLKSLKRRISPFFFRVTKSQLGLPKPSFRSLRCALSPLQDRIYRGVAARFLSQVSEAPTDRDALREWRRARAIRMLQASSNPALLVATCDEFRLPPLEASGTPLQTLIQHYSEYEIPERMVNVCKLVRKLHAEDRKVIVWSMFVRNLTMLEKQLADLGPALIHGAVPYAASDEDELTREQLLERFKTDPGCSVLIANPAACAESISLHAVCHDAIYFDRSFNCAHYLQSLDRIHRLGLSKDQDTNYYLAVAPGTIDDVVDDRLTCKMRDMKTVVEGALPGSVPGYWGEDLGDAEETDLDLVENHIRAVAKKP